VSERAAPQYCPYCGEESLVPWGELREHATWRCQDCLRVFEIRFQGILGR
jgi:transposase-like protein